MLTADQMRSLIKECEELGVGDVEDELLESIVDNIRNAVVPRMFLPGRLVLALLRARSDLQKAHAAAQPQPNHPRALPLPPEKDVFMVEIMRAWLVGETPDRLGEALVIESGAFADGDMPNGGAAAWGVFLCDVARHIASALADSDLAKDPGLALVEIARFFNSELADPDPDCKRTTVRMGERNES